MQFKHTCRIKIKNSIIYSSKRLSNSLLISLDKLYTRVLCVICCYTQRRQLWNVKEINFRLVSPSFTNRLRIFKGLQSSRFLFLIEFISFVKIKWFTSRIIESLSALWRWEDYISFVGNLEFHKRRKQFFERFFS